MYPPISQLINRRTTENVILGGSVAIPNGTYIGYNAYATGRDREAWGPQEDNFLPDRWGQTIEEIRAMYRRVNSQGSFIAFHGGRRACLGQKFAMFQTRLSVYELITRSKWKLDPTWPRKMTPVSQSTRVCNNYYWANTIIRRVLCTHVFYVFNLRSLTEPKN